MVTPQKLPSCYLSVLLAIVSLTLSVSVYAQPIKLLVFSKTNGFRHKSIAAAKESLSSMAKENNWDINFTEDSLSFNSYLQLKPYNAIIFLSTTGKIFDTAQQNAVKSYVENGGGIFTIHSGGTDCEKDWDWYRKMIGAKFKNHPKQQDARFVVLNNNHPATKMLPKEWHATDELYNFTEPVPSNVIPLIEVDETSYTGGTMGKHPLVWYQYFEGGRIFQTALGHPDDFYRNKNMLAFLKGAILWAAKVEDVVNLTKEFAPLIDDSLSLFDKYLGVPDSSLSFNLPKDSTGKYTEALGLNNDPLNVYSTIKEGNKTLLHVSGQMLGGLMTKEEYGDYHLKATFRWGDKKYAPRLMLPRDNGILYHCVGKNGVFWKVWKQCVECQVQEGDVGDLFLLGGTSALVTTKKKPDPKAPAKFIYTYSPKDSLRNTATNAIGRVCRRKSYENPLGKWNTIELIAKGDTAIYIVNGHINMVLTGIKQKRDGENLPLRSGKITIQSEGAEIDYKDILIKHIDAIPHKIFKEAFLQ